MRMSMLMVGIFFMTTSLATAERRVEFDKGLKKGSLLERVNTYKGIKPLTKTCEGGCPSPLTRWPCNDNERCGINCAARPPYGYCY